MIIEVWGPKAWRLIHCTAQSYPDNPREEDKHNYYEFYNNLPYILPCCICKEHFEEQLRTNPIKLGSQKELSYWLYDLHNNVNKMNKKKYSHMMKRINFIIINYMLKILINILYLSKN